MSNKLFRIPIYVAGIYNFGNFIRNCSRVDHVDKLGIKSEFTDIQSIYVIVVVNILLFRLLIHCSIDFSPWSECYIHW